MVVVYLNFDESHLKGRQARFYARVCEQNGDNADLVYDVWL
jgi:hypothetical protein